MRVRVNHYVVFLGNFRAGTKDWAQTQRNDLRFSLLGLNDGVLAFEFVGGGLGVGEGVECGDG